VKAVHDFGAGASIELEGPGASLALPFTQDVVPVVDIAGRRIVVIPPVMVGDESGREAEEAEEAGETEPAGANDNVR